MPRARPSPEMMQKVKLLYEAGWSMSEVSYWLEVPRGTINTWITRYGAEIDLYSRSRKEAAENTKQRIPAEEIDQVRVLYQMGLLTEEIANITGLTRHQVDGRLKYAGVERRSRSESLRRAFRLKPMKTRRPVTRNGFTGPATS